MVTEARLSQVDHYRAQVQFQGDAKLAYAVFYNAIFAFNPKLAGELRDENAHAIHKNLVRHIRTLLMGSEGFGPHLKEWIDQNVEPKLKPQVIVMLKRHFGDIL